MKTKYFKISIHKAGRSEPFHWRPVENGHLASMALLRYEGADTYNAQHFFVPRLVQVFWLWFIIVIEMKHSKLSSSYWRPVPGPLTVDQSGKISGQPLGGMEAGNNGK